MKLLKCKNGAILLHDGETATYWVVTEICGSPAKLFAGATPEEANGAFRHYAKGTHQ